MIVTDIQIIGKGFRGQEALQKWAKLQGADAEIFIETIKNCLEEAESNRAFYLYGESLVSFLISENGSYELTHIKNFGMVDGRIWGKYDLKDVVAIFDFEVDV